jgi:hypothetical protein
VLRLTDQSAAAVSEAVSDLAALTERTAWPEQYRSCNTGYCESVILERTPSPQGRGHQVRKLLKCGPPQTAFNRFAAEAPDPLKQGPAHWRRCGNSVHLNVMGASFGENPGVNEDLEQRLTDARERLRELSSDLCRDTMRGVAGSLGAAAPG